MTCTWSLIDHLFFRKIHCCLIRKCLGQVNALNHYWCETRLLPQAVLKLWCPDISFSRIPCMGPVLYPAKNEEIHSLISYPIFPCHFILLLRRNLHHVVASGLLCGSKCTGATHFQPWVYVPIRKFRNAW